MEFAKEMPFLRQAVRGTLGRNKTGDIRYTLRTVDSRLYYIISGKGDVTVGDEKYSLCPGCVVMFKAGTPYMWNVTEMQFYILNFDFSHKYSHITNTFHPIHTENFNPASTFDCGTVTDDTGLEAPMVLYSASGTEHLFRMLVTEYSVKSRYSDTLLSCGLKTLIYSVLRYKDEQLLTDEKKNVPLVRDIIEYIGENLGKDISNEKIAERFHFNSNYINRVFKKHTGVTMHEYILSQRISAAAEKLRSESTTVTEIARATGFAGPANFTKAFRKKMGVSPSEYRGK